MNVEAESVNDSIVINLTNNEAIVLLEWLSEFNQRDDISIFKDQAEQRILWGLEAVLEKNILETFLKNYDEILSKARMQIRDDIS